MNIINNEIKFCPFCMEIHQVPLVEIREKNIFKNVEVTYNALYEYCDKTDEYRESEDMIAKNDISMKNAYRVKMGLMTSNEINLLRSKYGISQSDLSILLGWGAKTITRYEGHQVQDKAHDAILRKINNDPEWFVELLQASKDNFSKSAFNKYLSTALRLYETKQDEYLRKSIQAMYVKYEGLDECNGGKSLDLNKVIDVVRYFSNSVKVKCLYKVKLMKLLWYADALAYKNHGSSITGLVYKALPMGAVPIGYDLIIDLLGINYEEIDFDEGTGYHFIPDNNNEYKYIVDEEKNILDKVIDCFGGVSKKNIVDSMHSEEAYIETAYQDVIQYKYAKNLSI